MSPGTRVDAAALEQLLEVTRQLARPLDLDTLLARIIESGRTVLRANRGTVFLYDDAADEFVVSVATGLGKTRIPGGRGIVGECGRTRGVVNVPDCYADPRFNSEVDKATGYRTRSLLSVPLIGYDDKLVGVLQLLNREGGPFDARDEEIAHALAAQCAVALQRARMTQELIQKERLERELAVAREIQLGILPQKMPLLAGYDIAGLSRPAEETGGDVFDIVMPDAHGAVLLLGDATGHGVGPALSVTQVRAMLRIALRVGATLDQTFREINDQLEQDLPANRFVTAFLGQLDAREHRVVYHAGGQTPILHFHAADGRCEWLEATTVPMGLLPQSIIGPPQGLALAPGDVLGLITDGVFEAQAPGGEMFGTERVAAIVRELSDAPLARVVEEIVAAVDRFAPGPQADDITLLLVRRIGLDVGVG